MVIRPDTLADTLAAELAEMTFRTRRRADPIRDDAADAVARGAKP
jgi:hypothetical protein